MQSYNYNTSPKGKTAQLYIKYLFDFIFSLCGVIILSPLYLITLILIKIFMPGPVFFKQKRVGRDGVEFEILKFRTMKVDREAEKNLDFSKDSMRLTKLGKILRRTKIDETAQLLNVLMGNMSLVGPRPTVMEQVEKYTAFQYRRLEVRPGMTGLAQVNGNIALSWDERITYDVMYIDNYSLWLDIKILFKTVLIVLLGEQRFYNRPSLTYTADKQEHTENYVKAVHK